jgi:hypothetical protein
MKVLVTKPFAYSSDGARVTNQFVAGDEPDLNEECIAGLESEGFITVGLPAAPVVKKARDANAPATTADLKQAVAELELEEAEDPDLAKVPVPSDHVIPDDWRQIKWFGLKALAQKIAGRDVVDSNDARAIVETELAARQG